MAKTPVAEFVAQNSDDLLRLALLDQGIVDDNVLLPGETVEVGVAVGAALATVDDVQLLQREFQLLGEVLNTSLQFARLQGRQLVEQRQDSNRVDSDSKDLDKDTEEPEIVEERVTGLLDNLEHRANNRSTQNNTQHLTLEHIRDPELEGLLVEAELLLEDESVVVRDRQRQNSADQVETEEEYQCLGNLALEPGWEVPQQQETTSAPELGEDIAVDERKVLDLTIETGEETELGFRATVGLSITKRGQLLNSSRSLVSLRRGTDIPGFGYRLPETPPSPGPGEAWCAARPCTGGTTGDPPG